VARYGQTFKDRAVARLLPPESAELELVSREVGIASGTLQRWREEIQSMPARGRAWTAAARLQAVITTASLSELDRNAWCREQGLFRAELDKWCASATTALSDP
jgi:transposase